MNIILIIEPPPRRSSPAALFYAPPARHYVFIDGERCHIVAARSSLFRYSPSAAPLMTLSAIIISCHTPLLILRDVFFFLSFLCLIS
jgi:hypothetical protein